MAKTRFNVSLDQDLAEFAKVFAAENRITVADIFTQYLLSVKRCVEGEYVEKVLYYSSGVVIPFTSSFQGLIMGNLLA